MDMFLRPNERKGNVIDNINFSCIFTSSSFNVEDIFNNQNVLNLNSTIIIRASLQQTFVNYEHSLLQDNLYNYSRQNLHVATTSNKIMEYENNSSVNAVDNANSSSITNDRHATSTSSSKKDDHGRVFLSGAASGLVEGFCVQPLELLKTRLQMHDGPNRLGMRHVIRDIASASHQHITCTLSDVLSFNKPMTPANHVVWASHFLRNMYRGGLPEIAGLIPRATAALSTLEFSRRFFRSRDENGQLQVWAAYTSGALSGVAEGMAFQPFQVVKVRLMAKEHLGRYKNSLDCVAKILRQEGASALLTGFGPTMWRNCIWNGLYYGTMYVIEQKAVAESKSGENPAAKEPEWRRVARTLAVGTCVGMISTCFNAPFDVVKTRFQGQLPESLLTTSPTYAVDTSTANSNTANSNVGNNCHSHNNRYRYRFTLPSLYHIYKAEGPRALYRGFAPKALRLGLGQSVGLAVFQACV